MDQTGTVETLLGVLQRALTARGAEQAAQMVNFRNQMADALGHAWWNGFASAMVLAGAVMMAVGLTTLVHRRTSRKG